MERSNKRSQDRPLGQIFLRRGRLFGRAVRILDAEYHPNSRGHEPDTRSGVMEAEPAFVLCCSEGHEVSLL